MDPKIGSSYGPYVVEAVIARGGQGLVLKTRHSQRGVPAALKILLDPSEVAKGRFLREMETLRLLANHPGLPTPYDLGEHQGTLFIALELVEGPSLSEVVRSAGALPEPEALRLVAKTARIVAQCHDQGVLHRDLKPANVILRESGVPCVVDFGVARVEGAGVSETSRLSVTGDLIGTPAFMAPEQVSGEGVGFQTDVYGLGSILYFLLSGQQPVSGTTSLNVLTRLARDGTPDVRQVNPAVSAPAAELLLRAMAKDPAERIQSAEVFAEELEALARTEGEAGSGRRLPLLLATVGALALLGLAAAFALNRGPDRAASATPSPSSSRVGGTPQSSKASLAARAPGEPTWETAFEGQAVLSHALLGPWALVESAPLLGGKPQRKLLQTRLVALEDGSFGPSLPRADLWCWESASQRAIGHVKGSLFSVSAERPTPVVLAEEVGALCSLATSSNRIYTSLPHLLQIRDLRGKVQREVPIPGHSEVAPLELDLDPDKPGPDHLLVVTTGSAALLLTMDGRERASTDLPGPVATLPVVLRAEGESAEIALVSGAGILTRLEARARNLRLLGTSSLGTSGRGRPLEPRGPLIVDRDRLGAPRRVFLHLLHGVACLSPDLRNILWQAEHPAGASNYVLTGLSTSDLDHDGERELLATFVQTKRQSGPRELVHLLFGPKGRAISAGALHRGQRRAESLPDGSLVLTSAAGTLLRWGPWSGLPRADPVLSARAPSPPRELQQARALTLQAGSTAPLPLRKSAEFPPLTVRFEADVNPNRAGNGVRVVGAKGVESVWFMGKFYVEQEEVHFREARFDVNYLLLKEGRPAGSAWLEIDYQASPKFGPAFVEFALVVNDRPLIRTVRAFHRKGLLRIPLGEINAEGLCAIKAYLTPRSRALVQVKSIRLIYRPER